VQASLTALAVPLIYYVGLRAWGRSVGLIAAGLVAIYPFSIFWGQYLIAENLLVVLFVVLAALLVRPGEAGPWRMLAAGLVAGLALLTRPTALPVVLLIMLWMPVALKRWRKWAVPLGLLLVGLGLALSPWVVRNYSVYGRFIPFTSGYGSSAGGYVFWISNNEYTAQPGERWGRYVAPEVLPENEEYTRLPDDPALLDRKGYEYGLRYLTTHPSDVPVLLLGKFLRFWNVFPGSSLLTRGIGALALLLLPFFLAGLREAWRERLCGGLLLAFIVGTMLVGLIFWADTRTRAPAEPFILLVSALGMVQLGRRWGSGRANLPRMTTP
jgi:4-amino-4-deoxy-L-arabinose transferase-like glycosyltransferase